MLEHVNLQKAEMKNEYKTQIKELALQLASLQQTVKEKKLPIAILFEGWGASGKGSAIAKMISNLDPRSFKVWSTADVDASELRRPLLWKYWNRIPEYGRIHIFDRSWYQEVSIQRLEGDISEDQAYADMNAINIFERQLVDDGYLIIKFFLHISQKEQEIRFKKLTDNKHTRWRVKDIDWKRNKHYNQYYQVFDEMCVRTNTPYAPWHIIGCHNKQSATYEIYHTLVTSIQNALDGNFLKRGEESLLPDALTKMPPPTLLHMPKLSEVNVCKTLAEDIYELELKEQQNILFKLQNKLYRKKIPVVIAFEGWDAAGKGGAIKRIAASLDPRGYEAVPVAAPTREEMAHHYLWRFWRNLPKSGHIAIFDRSWYGRVMVERLEKITPEQRWQAAYQEINEFEYELTRCGVVVVKFWLHIDKDEQLARFTERQATPEKRWKITDEDWRNREKWDDYEIAVDEMIQRTSTTYAQWNIIEANDKKFARIKVLKTLNNLIKERL